jgi:CheY-like chemotaxis protein
VVIRVRDEGIGIAPEMLPRVFDMFVQADTSLERSASGLGIGLTLVRSITELHGGTVEARSDGSGQGSEFVVRLPTLDIVTPAAPDRAPATAPALPGLRILIVDDNEDGAQSLAALLELQGHETSVAYRGTEVVPLAERFRPAVVLLDIGLPTINGYDVCRALRRQPWGAALVLIAVTGWGQEEDRRRSRAAGFDHHLVKPIEHGLLHEVLAASLARRAPSPSLEGP